MNNKEYKRKLDSIERYNGFDYLRPYEVKELRADIKDRKAAGATAIEGFNGRATIRTENGAVILTSYYTDVCSMINGQFKKLWDGYSATTLKHINKFRSFCGLASISKREWIEME